MKNIDLKKNGSPRDISPSDLASIGDFLSFWLNNSLLEPRFQKVFENYYWSYRDYFGKRMQTAYSEQIKEINGIIDSIPDARVLEIGFGLGTESLWLSMQGADVLGIDVVTEFVETAGQRKKVMENLLGRPLNCDFKRKSVLK